MWNTNSRARITNSEEHNPVPQRPHRRDENSLKEKIMVNLSENNSLRETLVISNFCKNKKKNVKYE